MARHRSTSRRHLTPSHVVWRLPGVTGVAEALQVAPVQPTTPVLMWDDMVNVGRCPATPRGHADGVCHEMGQAYLAPYGVVASRGCRCSPLARGSVRAGPKTQAFRFRRSTRHCESLSRVVGNTMIRTLRTIQQAACPGHLGTDTIALLFGKPASCTPPNGESVSLRSRPLPSFRS